MTLRRTRFIKKKAARAVEQIGPHIHLPDGKPPIDVEELFFHQTRQRRISEENPIRFTWDSGRRPWHFQDGPRMVEGILVAEIPIEAETRHILEIDSVRRAYSQAGRVGRRKGQPKPRRSGRPSLPDPLARAVYQAKADGKTWSQIAREVLRVSVPSDPKARNRLRGRIDRLYLRGARLASKKRA